MAVGLKAPQGVLPVAGVRLGVGRAGIRRGLSPDLLLMALEEDACTSATFTRNRFCAAPVVVAREHLNAARPRFVLVNAGNANAGTGAAGLEDARACCRAVAAAGQTGEQAVLPFSTGVIGQRLAVDKIEAALPEAIGRLAADNWMDAARAIMTTDTVPKAASRYIATGAGDVTMTGIAKGAGMICPDMATMLAFIATDARVDQAVLETLHRRLVVQSFNRISVDGDTSTNDACVLIATGRGPTLKPDTPAWKAFEKALLGVYRTLAQAIVRDAEGATKFVTIRVEGGVNEADCEKIARAVAHSPLVKTALYASDANWGRILAAVGRSGAEVDVGRVALAINGVGVLSAGEPDPLYSETAGSRAMAGEEIEIHITVGDGKGSYMLWTSDLSHDYVRINAEYRT